MTARLKNVDGKIWNFKLIQLIDLPKGKRARRMSLKFCLPKGMPMIVIHNMTPHKRCVSAIAKPPTNHQITFMMSAKHPDGKPPL